MAYVVPDTNTFALTDVRLAVNDSRQFAATPTVLQLDNLQLCFDVAPDGYFDTTYKGNKTTLYNFRNYNNIGCSIITSTEPYWIPSQSHSGNNITGLNIDPGGKYDGSFNWKYTRAYIWTIAPISSMKAKVFYVGADIPTLESPISSSTKYSLRLIRSTTTAENSYRDGTIISNVLTDGDGTTYNGAKMGSKVWITKHFMSRKFMNGINMNILRYSYYDTSFSNYLNYGCLYDATLANDIDADISGWYIPYTSDWDDLKSIIINNYLSYLTLSNAEYYWHHFIQSCRGYS